MNVLPVSEILQTISWFIALIELIVAFYVLLLNAWHVANWHMSLLLLTFAVNSFGLGWLLNAIDVQQARVPTLLLALTSESVKVGLLLIAVVLLRPQWMSNRWRWVWRFMYLLFLLPIALVLIDLVGKTNLWFVGVDPASYTGGYVGSGSYVTGSVARLIRPFYVYVIPVLTFVPLLAVALRRDVDLSARRLARMLTVVQLAVIVMQFGLRPLFQNLFGLDPVLALAATAIVTSTFFAASYASAAFQQMISERRVQRGRLQPRLTSLVIVVTVPTFLAISAFLITRSSDMLENAGYEKLEEVSTSLGANVDLWTYNNVRVLQQLVNQPSIVEMDAAIQTPILEAMDALSPHIYLVSTVNLDGINVARSDGAPPADYSDRLWFQAARNGEPVTFQTLVGRTSGEPALVVSMPIYGDNADIVGVAMFATDLNRLSEEVATTRIGETGVAYVVDGDNRIVAHPDPRYVAELYDAGANPAVAAMRERAQGRLSYVDAVGQRWHVAFSELDNRWGVVVQQTWAEMRQPLFRLGTVSGLALLAGSMLLTLLTYFTMRQAFAPINTLTQTVTAIADGDLTREAPVESEDELGTLSRSFNLMTTQLRDLITTLEERIAARTVDLQRRSALLEASAEVGRAASSILDMDALINRVVDLIRDRFDLYYVGLFLTDESRTWAVLQAGTGAAGRAMRERGHRIRVGEGMIGWSVENAQARVALTAESDVVRLATPELPETRSEAALPLRSRGQVLGAVTVQSAHPDAFDASMLTVLQTMADQVAVAIDNARLYSGAQAALEAERRAYGVRTLEAWNALAKARADWGYVATRRADDHRLAVAPLDGEWPVDMWRAQQTGQTVQVEHASVIAIPIRARDQVIGVLRFDRGPGALPWSEEDVTMLETLTDQLGQTLERAQLYQDTQRRAIRDRTIAEVGARVRESLELEIMLQTAVSEMRRVLDLDELAVRLATPEAVDDVAG